MRGRALVAPSSKASGAALVAAAGLGISADRLFWNGPIGPGLAVWVALLAASAALIARSHGYRWTRSMGAWTGAGVLAAAGTAWRASEELQALFFLVLLLSASVVVLEARGRSFGRTRLRDHMYGLASMPVLAATGGFPLLLRAEAPVHPERRRVMALGRGVLLAIPPVAVFAALFSAADPAFARLGQRLAWFGEERLLAHLFLTLGFGWVAAGLLRGALPGSRRNPLDRLRPPRLGVEETATVLGSVAGLFALFVVLQLPYLFGGRAVIEATSGLTLAEYARRGFFELVTASGLVLALLLAVQAAAPRGTGRWVFRGLAWTLAGLVVVVLLSAASRLALYVDEFGLTLTRLYVAAFMVWLGGTVVGYAVSLAGPSRRFASGALAAGVAVVFALAAANPDALVARTNLDRPADRAVDAGYLGTLGADAVPVLVDRLDAMGPDSRCTAARALLRRWTTDPADGAPRARELPGDWRTWNAGRAAALERVDRSLERLLAAGSGCPG